MVVVSAISRTASPSCTSTTTASWKSGSVPNWYIESGHIDWHIYMQACLVSDCPAWSSVWQRVNASYTKGL